MAKNEKTTEEWFDEIEEDCRLIQACELTEGLLAEMKKLDETSNNEKK